MYLLGTWTDMKVVNESDVVLVPRKPGMSIAAAATLAVNPCTAYRMLKDFEIMKPGLCFYILIITVFQCY